MLSLIIIEEHLTMPRDAIAASRCEEDLLLISIAGFVTCSAIVALWSGFVASDMARSALRRS